jgi:hypothetical protein
LKDGFLALSEYMRVIDEYSYLSISDRTQRSNFPEKVTPSYLSLEFGATAGKCLIRDRDGRALRNPTPVIEVRGLKDDPGQKKL